MLISVAVIALLSVSGLALTYLFAEDERLLWRLAAGNVIGSVFFFFPAYLFGSAFCLGSPFPAIGALVIAALPILLLFRSKKIAGRFRHEKDLARGAFQGANFRKMASLAFYLFFFVLLWFFFERAMILSDGAIFTGASQNLGDLPFHLGAIFSFSEGCNFPAMNPSFAGAKFTYPFTADYLTAVLVSLGAEVQTAMFYQNLGWAMSLLVIAERFASGLTGNSVAGRLAVPMLFFSGGLGFLWFLSDFGDSGMGFFEILRNLPSDYTIGDEFRWGNSLVTLFITQRSLLLGLPLALMIIGYLWKELAADRAAGADDHGWFSKEYRTPFVIGLIAGTLPLVHAHSLAVLFIVSGFWLFFSLHNWKKWFTFAAGTALIAVPELLWILTGSASRTTEFIGWHFGFQAGEENIVWFWFKNTGLFIPLLAAGILYFASTSGSKGEDKEVEEGKEKAKESGAPYQGIQSSPAGLLIYIAPFFFIFIVSNLFKFAPWEWDNIKVLIYWFAGSIPVVAALLALLWSNGIAWRVATAICLAVLVFSGALDVWRTASGQIRNQVFDEDAVEIAEWMRVNTDPGARFLNAPTYNSAVVLSGRSSLMRYIGHLSSHGIDHSEREAELKKIYAGAPDAEQLLRKYEIDYILVSPKERTDLTVNDVFLNRFPLAAEEGAYRVLRVER